MRRLLFFISLLLIVTGSASAEVRRLGIIIGNNLGHEGSAELHYAEKDAGKIREVLVEMGGYQSKDLYLLQGKSADDAWEAIYQIEAALEKSKAEGFDSLFLLYYSGHADGEVFEMGESSLHFGKLRKYLKKSSATFRLGIIDACMSGVIAKAGKRVPGYEIRLPDKLDASGFAIMTSSASNEFSYEVDEVGGSLFTHYLLSALRGQGDRPGDRDGQVTISEAFNYAASRTTARTLLTTAVVQHPTYDFEVTGHKDLVLTRTRESSSEIILDIREPGRVFVLDEGRTRTMGEALLNGSTPASFWLPAGNYALFFSGVASDRQEEPRGPGRYLTEMTRVHIPEHKKIKIDLSWFNVTKLSRSIRKGGLFKYPTGDDKVSVRFASEPAGSVVMVDEKIVCRQAPCWAMVSRGRHVVSMHAEWYRYKQEALEIEESTRIAWNLPLQPRKKDVLVIKSRNLQLFDEAVKGFSETFDGSTEEYVIDNDHFSTAKLIRDVRAARPRVILAVNLKQLKLLMKNINDIPIVFIMSVNPIQNELRSVNSTGVTLDPDPLQMLNAMHNVLPGLKKLGVLYDPRRNGEYIDSLLQASSQSKVSVVAIKVYNRSNLKLATSALIKEVDAILLIRDATVMSRKYFLEMLETQFEKKIPLITYTAMFVKKGALCSYSSSYKDQGKEAARIVKKILSGERPANISMHKTKGSLTMSKATARKLRINLPKPQPGRYSVKLIN